MKNPGTSIRKNLAYMSCIFMMLGIHLPLYIYSKGNNIGLEYRTNQEGILLLLSVALVIIEKNNNKIKYFLGPIIFQTGVVVYYIFHMVNDKNYITTSWGMVCYILAIVLLVLSMFINNYYKEDYTHDISTMRIIKTEEFEYNEKFILKDSVWIVGLIVITTCYVLFKINSDNNASSNMDNISSKSVSAFVNDEKTQSVGFDYTCDKYSIGINDAYITNEDGEEVVFLEINIKNSTHSALIFYDLFDVKVYQDNIELKKCEKVDSDVFDYKSGLAQISLLETSKIYIPYVLAKSQKNLKVSLISLEDDKKTVISDKVVKINDLYYADTLEEIISIGERKIKKEDNKEIKNDDKDDMVKKEEEIIDKDTKVENVVEDHNNTVTEEPVKDEDNNEKATSEPENTPEVEDEIPTEQAVDEESVVSGTVKFDKPNNWSEESKVYIYLYAAEEKMVEDVRIEMSDYNNGIYTFFLNKIDMSKDVYIAFGNDTKIYPENNKKLLLSMGKKYTSN